MLIFFVSDWSQYYFVCSNHFKQCEIKRGLGGHKKRLVPGAVPCIFRWNSANKSKPTNKVQDRRLDSMDCVPTMPTPADTADLASTTASDPTQTSTPHLTADHDYHEKQHATTEEKLASAHAEIKRLQNCVNVQSAKLFSIRRFATNPMDINFYTGFADFNELDHFFQWLYPTASKMQTWTQFQRGTDVDKLHCGFPCSLSLFDQLFVFLIRVRQGYPETHLAHLFNVIISTICRITITWANYLYFLLGCVCIWPSREMINERMPPEFKCSYPATRVIVDCTELKFQTPTSRVVNSEMFSHYKTHTTMKALIGIAPHGPITFISSLYEGCISDKEITKQSGLLSLLEVGDGVMADKGFLIDDLLHSTGAHLIIPPFLSKSNDYQFTRKDVENTQEISRLRIHVERAIRRVKEYHIFDGIIPLTIVGSVNQIWTVCCLLSNFRGDAKRKLMKHNMANDFGPLLEPCHHGVSS
ncbi:uncharacterized protein LOC125371546 isoform X1 [Haliotis rufescens]|uniref:uncharacterized protein LOC125371546 isoform X1 n=1 Tax=Haliotis rufescens TaxID=6454 RepID=UPI00201FA4DE|nr:uncharacterized protein LOC125371546 isoform X1 [Haliotis rufescens]